MTDKFSKPTEDGFISTLINRRLSHRISQRLVDTPVRLNALTVMDFIICVVGAFLFSLGQYSLTVLAGLLVQLASIIDGCDGEIARMRSQANPFGACLDTMLDRYADSAIVVGVSYAYWIKYADPRVWIVGLFALAGFVFASYARKEYQIRYRASIALNTFEKLTKRDFRLFGIMVGALLNRPYEAIVVLALLSHIWVLSSLFKDRGR